MTSALRSRFPFRPPEMTVDHLVVGGGVVGLAVARKLSEAFADRTTFLVERHTRFGEETSSRNSEVIHAGIYYPRDSLKSNLCIRGRNLLYKFCQENDINHRKTTKLIVATSTPQKAHLDHLLKHASSLPDPVPLKLLSAQEAKDLEPDLHDDLQSALLSPETGIVDGHGVMQALENKITDSGVGELVYGNQVVRIDRVDAASGKGKRGDGTDEGWVVQTATKDGETSSILAKTVVNSAGLNAHHVFNHLLPPEQRKPLFFAKGSYYGYKGPGVANIKRLIYPCPEPKFAGLGTHLTLNLRGDIRFGPDVEWLEAPKNRAADGVEEDEPDFWEKNLGVNEERLDSFYEAVKTYLPGVERDGFRADYSGIRPKLTPPGVAAEDFSITHPQSGFINLMGIESPGLTSSLAIAEVVEDLVRKEVWGLGVGRGRTISGAGRMEHWG